MKTNPSRPAQKQSVAMNGQPYAWDATGGLESSVALEVVGYVRKKAGGYMERARKTHLEYEDLVQEGMTGALKAAAKYRPDKGANYLTYAAPWIDAAMKDALRRSLVRTPDGAPFALIRSLDAPLGGDDEDDAPVLLDWQHADLPNAQDLSAAAEDRARVRQALPKLNARERAVLVRHMGLHGGKEQPLSAIAKEMGITSQWAGHLLDRAKANLRLHLGGRHA